MDIQTIVSNLKAERDRIDQAISALEGSSSPRGRPAKATYTASAHGKRGRVMSAAARARIGAAKKAWWAKQKGKSVPKKAAPQAKRAPARKPMSPAMKKRLSAMMKARWAEKKKAAGKE
jgi:geranylgeranyl pyrophosphate synthase